VSAADQPEPKGQVDEAPGPIMITGVGGFLGRSIARALLDRGLEVRGLCRGDYPDLRESGVDLHRGDIADAGVVSEALQGCSAVFHVAARIGIWGPYEAFFATNTTGTRNVIAACREHRIGTLVYTSTPSVVHSGEGLCGIDESVPYPDHFETHYPATKALAERDVLAADSPELATCALRPHLVWGPGDTSLLPRLLARAKAGRVRTIGEPQPIDTLYIDNAVHAHLLAYDRLRTRTPGEDPETSPAGKAYFITQGDPLPGPQFIADLLGAAGLPAPDKNISVAKARVAATIVEGLWTLFRIEREPPITKFLVSQLSTAHWYDISAARRDLGYTVQIPYAEGMDRLKTWLKDQSPS